MTSMTKKPFIITCGGGKGGVGKSSILSNIGAVLAAKGYVVGFVDADLGGPNLHMCLGVPRPKKNLADYLAGRIKDLSECAETTCIPNSWLISGTAGVNQLANPLFNQKQKLIRNIANLNADFILIDLGAGSHAHVVDFFAAFFNNIVIIDSLPTSVENAYGFLKNGMFRALLHYTPTSSQELRSHINRFADPFNPNSFITLGELLNYCGTLFPEEVSSLRHYLSQRKTFLVLNMVKTSYDIAVGKHFAEVIKKYLEVTPHYLGYCVYEPAVRQSIRDGKPIMVDSPPSNIATCFESIASNLLVLTGK
ncbi:MAG: P-loop NTPase [Chitinivibrionales bacterium]|nr:P-loop NTPase [Chitinivibrionales bacterium]